MTKGRSIIFLSYCEKFLPLKGRIQFLFHQQKTQLQFYHGIVNQVIILTWRHILRQRNGTGSLKLLKRNFYMQRREVTSKDKK